MAGEWKVRPTPSEDRMIEEVLAVRARDPYGPPATKTAVIKQGVHEIWTREVQGRKDRS